MQYFFSVILFFIASFHFTLKAQEPIDSLKEALKRDIDDSTRFDVYIDLHNAYFKSNPEESKQYAEKMLALGEQTNNLFRQYKGYLALNRYETKFRNYDKIIPNSKKLLALAKALKNDDEIFSRTLALAHNYIDGEKPALVVPQLQEALKLAQHNKNEAQLSKVNYALGFYYHNAGQSANALKYLDKAINQFTKLGDEKSLGTAIGLYAESSLATKPDPKTLNLLIVSERLHEKNKSLYRQAYTRALMGKYFVLNGNSNTAIENFEFSRSMFSKDNNTVDYALVGLDLASELLFKKKYNQAEKIIKESEEILVEKNYGKGIPMIKKAWAEYYLNTNQTAKANKALLEFKKVIGTADDPNLKSSLLQFTALNQSKSTKDANSFKPFFDYYKSVFAHKEQPYALSTTLNLLDRRYPGVDSNLKHIFTILKTQDGYAKLKNYFSNAEFNGQVLADSFLALIKNPNDIEHINDSLSDSSIINKYDTHLETVDAVLNKKLLLQSLVKQKEANQKSLILSILVVVLLTIIIVTLILYSRRLKKKKEQTEEDKKTIENLHHQLNHLVINNLNSVGNFIEKAMQESDLENAIQSLKIRVDIVTAFYATLKIRKSDNADNNVFLQQQIEDVAQYLKAVHNYDDSFLKINVDANIAVSNNIGVNLILLISELIQNSCKYAFTDNDPDKDNFITIQAKISKKNRLQIDYKDNGVGKAPDAKAGLGTQIIEEIEETLKAEVKKYNQEGYHYLLSLKLKPNEH